MIVTREIVVRHAEADSRMLIQVFADFCAANPSRYTYQREQTREYQEQIRADAVVLHRHDRFPFPAIALASGDGATMRVTNVVPQVESKIDLATYNAFAVELAGDLRRYRRLTETPITVHCTAGELTLEDIIPAAKTRCMFEQYLSQHPTSRHPADIHRLDVFICAVHRYCRGRLNGDRLQRYLVEVLRWKPADATWCRDRILTGVDILRVDRHF